MVVSALGAAGLGAVVSALVSVTGAAFEGAASAFVGVASGVRPPHAPTNETDTRTIVVASLERMKRR